MKLIYSIPFLAAGASLGLNYVKEKRNPIEPAAMQTAPQVQKERPSHISISDRHGKYTYSVSPTRKNLKVTIASAVPQKSREGGGSVSTLLYLDRPATKKFKRDFHGSKSCPAPFFNRHSDAKLIYATDPKIKAELKRWNQPYWKKTQKWETATLKGRCVTGTTSYVLGKQDMTKQIHPDNFRGCQSFLVEAIENRVPFSFDL